MPSVDALEEQEFYELMQEYRHAPLVELHTVNDSFEAVKNYIRSHFEPKEDY